MGVYYNLTIWLITPQIFANPITLSAYIIYFVFGAIDGVLRPYPEEITLTKVEKAYAILVFL